MQSSGWVSVRCVFASTREGRGVYEERITLWRAKDLSQGIELAEAEAAGYAEELSSPGDRTEYLGLAQAYALVDEPVHGGEVFSLMRVSDLAPTAYLDAFFATGAERAQGSALPPAAAPRWSLDGNSPTEDVLHVVADLRPPARAYLPRPVPIGLVRPLSSALRFLSAPEVVERLAGLPHLLRDLLPPDASWCYGVDEPPSAPPGWRPGVQLIGTPAGVSTEDLTLAGMVRAGAVHVVVYPTQEGRPPDSGFVSDPVRGDSVTLVVRGMRTRMSLPEPGVTAVACWATFAGNAVLITVECRADPARVLEALLRAGELT